jgi:hypothetical protein
MRSNTVIVYDRFYVEQGFKRVIAAVRREEYTKVTGQENTFRIKQTKTSPLTSKHHRLRAEGDRHRKPTLSE